LSGDLPVRLMWSDRRTGIPTRRSGLMEPAALVSRIVRHPAAAAVRTGCTTVEGGCPSYMWTRPAKARTVRPPASDTRTRPPWPGTVEPGKPGRSVAAVSASGSPRTSRASPQPEPRTTATSGRRPPAAPTRASPASSASRNGSLIRRCSHGRGRAWASRRWPAARSVGAQPVDLRGVDGFVELGEDLRRELSPAGHTGLGEPGLHVVPDGVAGEVQRLGHLRRAGSPGDEAHDLLLAAGQVERLRHQRRDRRRLRWFEDDRRGAGLARRVLEG